MAKSDFLSVKIDRIGEGPHDAPVVGMNAYSVRIDEKGTLHVDGERLSRVFGVGTWDGMTVSHFAAPEGSY